MKTSIANILILIAFIALTITSCTGGKILRTEPSTVESLSGIFNVIFYYNQDYEGLKQVVILDVADDDHTIALYEPGYFIRTVKHMNGDDAIINAVKFLEGHPNYMNYKILKIVDQAGNTVGFEVRPLYLPEMYGISDVMDNYYILQDDGTITAIISLKQQIKAIFEQDKDK
jgi:hypothetical protein